MGQVCRYLAVLYGHRKAQEQSKWKLFLLLRSTQSQHEGPHRRKAALLVSRRFKMRGVSFFGHWQAPPRDDAVKVEAAKICEGSHAEAQRTSTHSTPCPLWRSEPTVAREAAKLEQLLTILNASSCFPWVAAPPLPRPPLKQLHLERSARCADSTSASKRVRVAR